VRAPLQVPRLSDALPVPWTELSLVDETASTNADLVRDAAAGRARPWSVLVTEHQRAGRGRLGRTWTAVPGATLTFSALVPTPRAPAWVPLLAGLAVADTVEELYAVRPALKWPNDVLAPVGHPQDGRKLAGILCELTAAGIVVGIGLNVDQSEDELPVPTATSLRLLTGGHPGRPTREHLLLRLLAHLAEVVTDWDERPEPVRDAYRRSCTTLGREVQVDTGAGGRSRVRALEVDDDGRLVVDRGGERSALAAGDVTHVR
jgi:BirA family transcriptional regulator, biotin operon repressor / biotin---[acetyl-CoA-carboxylase] ligase